MIVLSALLASMVGKGIITEESSREVHNLYSLQRILEGAADRLLSVPERQYVEAVNKLLEERRFDLVPMLPVPPGLVSFKDNLLRLLPSLRESLPVV